MPGCEESCQSTKSRRDDNCYDADPTDGLPVQCVGEWGEEKKHLILRNFIEATQKARSMFLPPQVEVVPPSSTCSPVRVARRFGQLAPSWTGARSSR